MTYRLWWTVGYVCTTEKEFRAAKHRLLPAAYEAGARRFFVEQEPPFVIPRIEAAAQ